MGAGASADNARHTVSSMLMNKPEDASDISDLDKAKAEIISLRKMAKLYQEHLSGDTKNGNYVDKGPKKREAVRDQAKKVRVSVSASAFIVGDYTPKVFEKSDGMRSVLNGIVTTNILFSSYGSEEHTAIVDAFQSMSVAEGQFVINQGESGEQFFVVESGSLEIYVKNSSGENQKVGNTLGPGSSFGELALMYNTPRAAPIPSDCKLYAIERDDFRGVVVEIKGKQLGSIMNESELEKMTSSLERELFESGETIIRQGNKGDHFYII
eukprot:GSChrysophyteH2.ASY1.ANO1.274.1 assembled CDS